MKRRCGTLIHFANASALLETIPCSTSVSERNGGQDKSLPASEIELGESHYEMNEQIYCDNCKTSIVDFHLSYPQCLYDLCVTCCRELRGGFLQGGDKEVVMPYHTPQKVGCMHGATSARNKNCGKEVDTVTRDVSKFKYV